MTGHYLIHVSYVYISKEKPVYWLPGYHFSQGKTIKMSKNHE